MMSECNQKRRHYGDLCLEQSETWRVLNITQASKYEGRKLAMRSKLKHSTSALQCLNFLGRPILRDTIAFSLVCMVLPLLCSKFDFVTAWNHIQKYIQMERTHLCFRPRVFGIKSRFLRSGGHITLSISSQIGADTSCLPCLSFMGCNTVGAGF